MLKKYSNFIVANYVRFPLIDLNGARKRRGLALKEFRIEKGLSIEALAKLSKLHKATIYRIENGEKWNIDSEILYFETLKNYEHISKAE